MARYLRKYNLWNVSVFSNNRLPIAWKNKESDFRIGSIQDVFTHFGIIDGVRLVNLLKVGNLVLLGKYAKRKIHRHIIQKKIELGGLLIGNVFEIIDCDRKRYITVVRNCVPSLDSKSSNVSLYLGTDVWTYAQDYINQGLNIVGWYHSHPGFGAFFSSTDKNTQKNFFMEPFQVGLVADPYRKEDMWFAGRDSEHVQQVFML